MSDQTPGNALSRRGAQGEEQSPAKLRGLISLLAEKGIPYEYSIEDGFHVVRVYFTDVWEVMGIDWRGKEWDELVDVLIDLASEIRKVGWDDDENWEEQTDRWLFFVEASST